jgi:hypothetical protein
MRVGFGLLAAALIAAAPTAVRAQAWTPPAGEGSVSILFSHVLSKDHFLPATRIDIGHIEANTLLIDLTYGVTDRLAVAVAFPVVATRYRGQSPHEPVTLDDGRWHVTPQDFRCGVRYNVSASPLVITPFAGVIVPSHSYAFYAHAAPGKRLRAAFGGVSVGKLFAGTGVVLQGRYGLAVAERVAGITPWHSDLSLEASYFVLPALRVFALGSGRRSHSGIDLRPGIHHVLSEAVYFHHDRISREHVVNLGAGATVAVSDAIDVFGSYTSTVAGRNTHAVNRGLAIGASWSFGRRPAVVEEVTAAASPAARARPKRRAAR